MKGEDENKSSSLYAEESVERLSRTAARLNMNFALQKRLQKQRLKRECGFEKRIGEKPKEGNAGLMPECRTMKMYQVQLARRNQRKNSNLSEDSYGKLQTIVKGEAALFNSQKWRKKQVSRLKRNGVKQIPLYAGTLLLLFIVIIMFAGTLALYGSEDKEFSPDTGIVEVAEAQLGNVGGMKFWKWYGFNEHVDWCACFVSWCANQCGYIDTEKMPKFSY